MRKRERGGHLEGLFFGAFGVLEAAGWDEERVAVGWWLGRETREGRNCRSCGDNHINYDVNRGLFVEGLDDPTPTCQCLN